MQKFIKTEENWFPNYPNNTVKVRTVPMLDGKVRVWLEGKDDFAMCQEYPNQKIAESMFERVIDNITKEQLEDMGLGVF